MLLPLLVLISITSVPKNSNCQLFCNEVSLSSSYSSLGSPRVRSLGRHTQLGSTAVIGSWRRNSNSAKSFPLFHNRNVICREHIINSSCENGYRRCLQSWSVCCIKSKVVWRWTLMRNDMKVLIAEGPIRHPAFNSSLFLLKGGKASKLCFVLLEVIYFRSFYSILFNIAHWPHCR